MPTKLPAETIFYYNSQLKKHFEDFLSKTIILRDQLTEGSDKEYLNRRLQYYQKIAAQVIPILEHDCKSNQCGRKTHNVKTFGVLDANTLKNICKNIIKLHKEFKNPQLVLKTKESLLHLLECSDFIKGITADLHQLQRLINTLVDPTSTLFSMLKTIMLGISKNREQIEETLNSYKTGNINGFGEFIVQIGLEDINFLYTKHELRLPNIPSLISSKLEDVESIRAAYSALSTAVIEPSNNQQSETDLSRKIHYKARELYELTENINKHREQRSIRLQELQEKEAELKKEIARTDAKIDLNKIAIEEEKARLDKDYPDGILHRKAENKSYAQKKDFLLQMDNILQNKIDSPVFGPKKEIKRNPGSKSDHQDFLKEATKLLQSFYGESDGAKLKKLLIEYLIPSSHQEYGTFLKYIKEPPSDEMQLRARFISMQSFITIQLKVLGQFDTLESLKEACESKISYRNQLLIEQKKAVAEIQALNDAERDDPNIKTLASSELELEDLKKLQKIETAKKILQTPYTGNINFVEVVKAHKLMSQQRTEELIENISPYHDLREKFLDLMDGIENSENPIYSDYYALTWQVELQNIAQPAFLSHLKTYLFELQNDQKELEDYFNCSYWHMLSSLAAVPFSGDINPVEAILFKWDQQPGWITFSNSLRDLQKDLQNLRAYGQTICSSKDTQAVNRLVDDLTVMTDHFILKLSSPEQNNENLLAQFESAFIERAEQDLELMNTHREIKGMLANALLLLGSVISFGAIALARLAYTSFCENRTSFWLETNRGKKLTNIEDKVINLPHVFPGG